jgi:hypothetical protein
VHAPPDSIPLRAGSLSCLFQPREAALRYIFAGPHEVLRGIAAPVRDHVWQTIPPGISDLVVDQQPGRFRVAFVARHRAPGIDFRWRGEISAAANGTLTFGLDGEVLRKSRRNRIGFCVLHPGAAAGAACEVEHVDGRRAAGAFPRDISPHQPFFDLRAIAHDYGPGLRAEVRMEGDTFEMEDQRNWTDDSFKTYCTPLALPWPVILPRGTRIQQRITLHLHEPLPAPARDFCPPWQEPESITAAIGARLGPPLPALGTTWNAIPSEPLLAALRPLQLAHLRVDLRLADRGYPAKLRHAAAAASALATALEPAVFVDDDAPGQLRVMITQLLSLPAPPRVARWLIFHEARDSTPPELVPLLHDRLGDTPFSAPIGGGATGNFTELNRARAICAVADFTCHACNPQVHASDAASVVETLPVQGLTVTNARRHSSGRPAVLSPLTFTPRWRVGAAGAPPARPAGLMPFLPDPRQASPFVAAWALGSIASLACHGVASATCFEVAGPAGVIGDDGQLLPVGEVLRLLAPFTGADVIACHVSHPLRLATLAFETSSRRLLAFSNLATTRQHVSVHGAWGARSLDLAPHQFGVATFD